jgi:cell division transport system permease protein
MSAWIMRHLQTLVGSLGRLMQHKLATLLTILVIGIALALPAGLHLLVTNAQGATGNWNRALDLSVFLKRPTSAEDARRTVERIRQRRDVESAQLTLADEALKAFRRESGFGAAIDALNENPLPHTLVVRPAPEHANAAGLEILATDIRALPSVDIVQLDTDWVNRLDAILAALRAGLLIAAGVLALGVLVIVGNTIRLDIQNRRDEIEVTKLVGGSDGFVRRPFLYNGMWYGLGGGLTALLIIQIALALLRAPISRVAGLYGSDFRLTNLTLESALVLLLTGAGLGWLGSYIAASHHLRRIEPS